QIDRKDSSCASVRNDSDCAALGKFRTILDADDFIVRDRQRHFGEVAPVKPPTPPDANRFHRAHAGDRLDRCFEPATVERCSEREFVGRKETDNRMQSPPAKQCFQNGGDYVANKRRRLDANIYFQIDNGEDRVATPGFAAGEPETIELRGQFGLLGGSERKATFRVGRGENSEPTSSPTESRSGTLHPRQALDSFRVILGTHGAERDR